MVRHRSLRSSNFWGPETKSRPLIFLSLRIWTRLNLYAHIDLQAYTVCILETFTTLIIELRIWIHKMYRVGLPSISTDLPPIGQLTGLDSFNQWFLASICSTRPQTCFLNQMQQNHPDNTLPNSKLMNCKHRRCEYIQEPQIYKQLSAILPTFLTDLSSRANTFNRSLVSSLTSALPQAMLPDANCN